MNVQQIAPVALAAAVFGGAAGAAVVAVSGDDGGTTTTVVQQAPVAAANTSTTGDGLTARDIYKRDAPGVAYVRAEVVQRTQSPFDMFPTEQRGEATGSGFVVDEAGDILTNAHVVEGAVKVSVQFSDSKSVPAKVVGRDASTDLALL